jgi:protein-tyrosine phosphatase
MSFTVLFVCTGNICRSPMAERLFQARTDPALAVRAVSAGTHGLTGWGMDDTSAFVLRELGGDGEGHEAQRLSSGLIAAADLILTAETEHRTAVVRADPHASPRAFTMREFARLGADLGPLPQCDAEQLRARIAQVAERRVAQPPAGPMRDDIGDPYGAALELVRACGLQIATAVDADIAALGLARVPVAAPDA